MDEPGNEPEANRNGTVLLFDRYSALEEAYTRNIQTDPSLPYAGVVINSLAELQWIMQQRRWSGERFLPDGMERANLRRACLDGAHLEGVHLIGADLTSTTLYGADLAGAHLSKANLTDASLNTAILAQADLRESNFTGAVLRGADLHNAMLYGVDLTGASFDEANLAGASLDEANLTNASFHGADLTNAALTVAQLTGARLDGANLTGAHLRGADLTEASLEEVNLTRAHLHEATLANAVLTGADLTRAHLERADLTRAHLERADLTRAHLERADLSYASLTGVTLSGAVLEGASLVATDLTDAEMDSDTDIADVKLSTKTRIRDVLWNDVRLTRVDWAAVPRFGDEQVTSTRERERRSERALRYRNAARAYHGLVIALNEQGLGEVASTYRLREMDMREHELLAQRKYGAWLLYLLLGALAGHGERPGRIVVAYVISILTFSAAYWGISVFVPDGGTPQLSFVTALVLSITSFHGRGYIPPNVTLGPWSVAVSVVEAIIGFVIEVTFIAAFSRRFLGD